MSTDRRRTIRDMLDEMESYFEEFERDLQEVVRSSINTANDSKPFVAGFSFRLGPEGRPIMQVFGDQLSHQGGFRSPMVEQFVDEKAAKLRLVFDMPGVEKSEIKVDAGEDAVVVIAENTERKYRSEVELKVRVDSNTAKAEYRNGVLELSFSFKDKDNKGFKRVDIV